VSSWKGPELERAAKVGACKCQIRFERKLPLMKPQDLKRSFPLNQQLKEAFPQRSFKEQMLNNSKQAENQRKTAGKLFTKKKKAYG